MTEKIIVEPEEIYEVAANIIEEAIKKLLQEEDKVILAIPGGRSVPGIFNLLKNRKIDWENVHIFMIDERLVTLGDKESNFRLAKENFIDELVDKGKLHQENIHAFIFDPSQPDNGTKVYEEELKKLGGYFDIILLSSGEDGHIGALYPEHHSIDDESGLFITMQDSPKPPPQRMSSSRKLLLESKIAIILFVGKIKKQAYENFNNPEIDHRQCPAKIVNEIPEAYVVTNIK